MKRMFCFLLLPIVFGCGKSDDELRKMMREEISKTAERSYFTNAQVIGPYSPAVRVGSMLFISGQIGINQETTELVGDDIESQTRQALMNLRSILMEAGCDSNDVVQCSVFLKDIKDFTKMNLIYGGFFSQGQYPARTTVEVSNLPKNAKVEIAAIAIRAKS